MPVYAEYLSHVGKVPPTTPDIEGPFYKPAAPFRNNICDNVSSTLELRGQVLDTSENAIAGAVLDFWQANEQGEYDNLSYRFRGKQQSNAEGVYVLQTVRPGDYKINESPPDFRCAHIHVKVTADGFKPLTTQLYFEGAAHNDTDHWFDPARVIHDGRFDFVLAPA